MDKRAELGDQLALGMFLFLMTIIGLGIIGGVYLFYGYGYDFRSLEANLLGQKVISCLGENEINAEFFNNFYKKCNFNQQVLSEDHKLKICSNVDLQTCIGNGKGEFVLGSDFDICLLNAAKKNRNYPKCETMEFKKGESTYVVLAVSNQQFKKGIARYGY